MRVGAPLHPWRFLGLAAVLGIAFAVAVERGVERLPWTQDSIYYEFFFDAPGGDVRALAFVLATLATAWVLRSQICSARGISAAKLAAWIGFPGAVAFGVCWWVASIAYELVHPIGDGLGLSLIHI